MKFRREIRAALKEDRAWGDITSRLFVSRRLRSVAQLRAQEIGVLAGVEAAAEAFHLIHPACRVHLKARDGERVKKKQLIFEVEGPLHALLAAERTALNVLSHLSGIATLTRRFVDAAGPGGPRILDTRKTLPGLRDLQKYAVRCGGGQNHRRDLSSDILIKENHLSAIRGERDLLLFFQRVKAARRRGLRVEMECRNKKEIHWGLLAGADILLLDNFHPQRLSQVVRWVHRVCGLNQHHRPLLEVSGGVRLSTLRHIARSGVDRVSIGRLTHSVPSLDINMDIQLK